MEQIDPREVYKTLGFTHFKEEGPFVEAALWRGLQNSPRLEDMRQRYLLRRDQAGQPIVDEGYVVGQVPAHTLSPEEVEKLLGALTECLTRGFTTVKEWQDFKAAGGGV